MAVPSCIHLFIEDMAHVLSRATRRNSTSKVLQLAVVAEIMLRKVCHFTAKLVKIQMLVKMPQPGMKI
jgi:hypothetical protein